MSTNTENHYLRRAFLSFFIPSAFSAAVLSLSEIADCFFIGSQMGADGLAIIGFGTPIYALYTLISSGITTGMSIKYSAALSNGSVKKGNSIFLNTVSFVFVFTMCVSLLGIVFLPQLLRVLGISTASTLYFGAKKYITAILCMSPFIFVQIPFVNFVYCDNNPKLSSAASVVSCIVDVATGYLAIIVLKTGPIGSVISTLLGAVTVIAICMPHILSKKTNLSFCRFHLDMRDIVNGFITGLSTNAQYAYNFIVLLIFNNLMMKISGENGVACFDVVTSISVAIYGIIENIGMTLQTLVSTFFEERNTVNIKNTLRYSIIFGGATCVLTSALLWIGAPLYCILFGLNDVDLLKDAISAIHIFLLSVPFKFAVLIMAYYYQTVKKEWLSYSLLFISEMAGVLLAGVLFSFYGFYAFWWCYLIGCFAALIPLIICRVYKKSVLTVDLNKAVFSAFINNSADKISDIEADVQRFCILNGAATASAYNAALIVEEVSTAIFKKQQKYDIRLQLTLVKKEDGSLVLHMRDNSRDVFNPFDIKTADLIRESTNENAIGMRLVNAKAAKCFYRRYIGFNTLTIQL